MFLCAALTASMMATAPALVQAAEEKETTETTESNAVRQDLAGLKYDHSLELQYADQFSWRRDLTAFRKERISG